MQLSNIRDAVRETAGLANTDPAATDTVTTGFINRAIQTVNMQRDWDWLRSSETITTVVDQANYAVAADWRKSDRLLDDTNNITVRPSTALNAAHYQNRGGLPVFWYIDGGVLYLSPTPSRVQAYTHHYIKSETALSADTDEPAMPDWAMPLVITKAALLITARMDNTSLHRLLKDDERTIMRAIQGEARRQRGPARIDTRSDWEIR